MTLDNLPLETEAVITPVGGEGALRCRFLDGRADRDKTPQL